MRFLNVTNNLLLEEAAHKAEILLSPESRMIKELCNKNDFRYGSGGGLQVVEKLILCREKTVITLIYPKNKNTKMIGNFDGEDIEVNAYKVEHLSLSELAGLILHEHSHKAGFHHTDPGWVGYKLRNFKTQKKCLYSVPYFLSENTKRWL